MSDLTSRDNLQGFIDALKKEILEETKRAYGEKAFDRWRNPLYEGALENPDGYACLRSSCGDSMEMFLQFDGERVSRASFRTAGCGAGAVCGSYAAEMALHKSPEEILKITGESLLAFLGGLPAEEEPMATLAANTLHAALQDFLGKP
ncbi:MAG: iron-sulfur cluster assembly scaffold protein [Desulfobacterota bacterium]|nr:iron-sulfur cluster assembly scaffold protein [Thermodesulfobacteriota bacterium]